MVVTRTQATKGLPEVRLAGRYRLDERIGSGGMGEVWRATDEILGRTVAVKVMLPTLLGEPDFLRRFLAEARAMASVNHPGVAAIHDYGSDPAGAYLVMEYVEGEALSRTLGRLGRLEPAVMLDLMAQAADALQAAHDKGIVHRDVKPANLLLRRDGRLVLTDFGIASSAGTALTSTGAIVGTPSYLSPEQVLGQPATPLSDVYALGVVAYECLTGRRPFQGDNPFAVAMMRVRQAPPPLGGDVPAAVAAVVQRCLATDPAHRWRSAAELAAAARGSSTGTPTTALVVPVRAERGGRRRLVPGVAVLVLVGLALVGLGAWRQFAGGAAAQGPETPRPTTHSGATPGPANRSTGPPAAEGPGGTPAGFVACRGVFCPPEPMCWGGLTIPGGLGREPRSIDCAELHHWETFAVGHLPPEAAHARQEKLIDHPAIAVVCSESVLAERSRDPAATRGWQREPWPVQVDRDTWIFHCLAGTGTGERTGFQFHRA